MILGTLVLQMLELLIIEAADPCLMPKAARTQLKLPAACHIRDGVAMAILILD